MTSRMRTLVTAGAAGLAVGGVIAAGLRSTASWGATRDEFLMEMEGDDLVRDPTMRTTHAVTVDAPPEAVWPWIIQMGYERGGWYLPYWMDHTLFGHEYRSAETILPEYQGLGVGDTIPDGPPGTAWYDIVRCEPPHVLVLHSTTHVWASLRARGGWIDWTWAFRLFALPGGRTRLVVRVRGRLGPWWLRALYAATVVPGDALMAYWMLTGIARRAAPTPHPSHAPLAA